MTSDKIPDEIMREAERTLAAARAHTAFLNSQEQDAIAKHIARALMARDQRAAEIADRWLSTFGSREIKHTSAREYACDAVSDIRDAILSYDEDQQ